VAQAASAMVMASYASVGRADSGPASTGGLYDRRRMLSPLSAAVAHINLQSQLCARNGRGRTTFSRSLEVEVVLRQTLLLKVAPFDGSDSGHDGVEDE